MQTVRIQTTQNIDIDYEVAGLGDRVLARLTDWGIFIALFIVGSISASVINGGKIATFILIGIYAGVYVFYDLFCEMFLNGQSLGKRILKIRVVSLNGARPSIGQYLIRWIFRIVDFGITGGVGAVVCVAVSQNQQRIGDIVAGTTVIKTTPRTNFDHISLNMTPTEYEPVFKEAAQLTDKEINLINDVVRNFQITGNNVLVYNMGTRLKEHLGITLPPYMNELVFLQTLLKDYHHWVTLVDD
jgi:uncharacterized RDD family membrane protein YckC